MPWKITITVKEQATPEVFVIKDNEYILRLNKDLSPPPAWPKTVEEVADIIWKELKEIGAYKQVIDDRSIIIPLYNIRKIEITKG